MPLIPLQQLYEELNRRGHDPQEYNRLLASLIAELSQSSGGAQFTWVNGTPYTFDPMRQKMLSLSRPTFTSAYYGNQNVDRYMRVDGVTTAGQQGLVLPRPATITGLWAKSRSAGAWSIEVRKNGIPITLVQVPVISSIGIDDTIDVDLDEGDWLQFYLDGSGVEHPIAALELAYRIEP